MTKKVGKLEKILSAHPGVPQAVDVRSIANTGNFHIENFLCAFENKEKKFCSLPPHHRGPHKFRSLSDFTLMG